MAKFRIKPGEIEAVQLQQRIAGGWPDWFHDAVSCNLIITHNMGKYADGRPASCDIRTLHGTLRANEGDWIVCGVSGDIYPCKPEVFAQVYELVPEEAAPQ